MPDALWLSRPSLRIFGRRLLVSPLAGDGTVVALLAADKRALSVSTESSMSSTDSLGALDISFFSIPGLLRRKDGLRVSTKCSLRLLPSAKPAAVPPELLTRRPMTRSCSRPIGLLCASARPCIGFARSKSTPSRARVEEELLRAASVSYNDVTASSLRLHFLEMPHVAMQHSFFHPSLRPLSMTTFRTKMPVISPDTTIMYTSMSDTAMPQQSALMSMMLPKNTSAYPRLNATSNTFFAACTWGRRTSAVMQ